MRMGSVTIGSSVASVSSLASNTRSRAPLSTCWPVATRTSATTPSAGAAMWCSIFMASSTTSVSPAETAWPAATRTSSTTPGMGATNPPATSAGPGTTKRGSTRRCTVPRGDCTWRRSPASVTSATQRCPSTSTSIEQGVQACTRATAAVALLLVHQERPVSLGPVGGHHVEAAERERHPLGGRPGVAPAAGDAGQHRGVGPVAALEPEGGGHGHATALVVVDVSFETGAHPLDEVGGGVAGQERRVAQGGHQEVPVGGDAAQVQPFQRQGEAAGGLGAGGGVRHDLGQHGVELHAHHRAGHHARVPAHRGMVGGIEHGDGAGGGQEPGGRVLGVEAGLDGVAGEPGRGGGFRDGLAGGHPQLLADQVDPGDLLGHGVLHLEAGVDLEEEELAGVVVHQELDGAGGAVADGPGQLQGGVAHGAAEVGIDHGRRRLLEHLLVAALDGALALAQVDHGAVGVAQDLDLDVAGAGDVALQEHAVVAEAAERLAAGGHQGVGDVLFVIGQAHALAAAAGGRLHQQRVAHLVGPVGVFGGGQRGHAGFDGGGLGPDLVAHGVDHVGLGPTHTSPASITDRANAGVLGQEAVAGVDGVGARAAGGVEDGVAVEVAAGEAHGLVGVGHERGAGVGVDEHGHGAQAHGARRAEHAAGDLAAVGHQDAGDGGGGHGGGAHSRNTP